MARRRKIGRRVRRRSRGRKRIRKWGQVIGYRM